MNRPKSRLESRSYERIDFKSQTIMMMGGINKHRVSPLFKHFQVGQQ